MTTFNTAPATLPALCGAAMLVRFFVPADSRWSRLPLLLSTSGVAAGLVFVWPWNANHSLLTIALVGSAVFLRPGDINTLRQWRRGVTTLLGTAIFLSGAQKVLYGTYFDARALVWPEHFEWIVRLFVTEGSREMLVHVRNAQEPGSVVLRAPLLVAASNSVWLIELFAGLGLFWKRTRRWSLYLFLALMIPTQLAAIELGFSAILLPYAAIVDEGRERRWLVVGVCTCVVFSAIILWGAP